MFRRPLLETIIPDELIVVRGFLSPRQCRRFGREILAIGLDPAANVIHTYGEYKNRVGQASAAVLGSLGVKDGNIIALNRQQPGETQPFHTDFVSNTVVNFEGEGSFDYAPDASTLEEAELLYQSVPVDAGDLLIAPIATHTLHRGRNTGASIRTNLLLGGSATEVLDILRAP